MREPFLRMIIEHAAHTTDHAPDTRPTKCNPRVVRSHLNDVRVRCRGYVDYWRAGLRENMPPRRRNSRARSDLRVFGLVPSSRPREIDTSSSLSIRRGTSVAFHKVARFRRHGRTVPGGPTDVPSRDCIYRLRDRNAAALGCYYKGDG